MDNPYISQPTVDNTPDPPVAYKAWSWIDKSDWQEGVWNDEPDCVRWTDPDTGYICGIARTDFAGHLCGYVGIPHCHPWYYRQYIRRGLVYPAPDAQLKVHGGVTYSGAYYDNGPLDTLFTAQQDKLWFFGFDCGHMMDVTGMAWRNHLPYEVQEILSHSLFGQEKEYRDIAYVTQQCQGLALQLQGMEPWLKIRQKAHLNMFWRTLSLLCEGLSSRSYRRSRIFKNRNRQPWAMLLRESGKLSRSSGQPWWRRALRSIPLVRTLFT